MLKDLSLESRNIETQSSAATQFIVWPRNVDQLKSTKSLIKMDSFTPKVISSTGKLVLDPEKIFRKT